METPLSPLIFADRARNLHPNRQGVVDGARCLTWLQFFERCDKASVVLQQLGVKEGDRVVTIAPNVLGHLECFYSIPQIGAVLVPLNYRLTPDDFLYMINHSGASVVMVHSSCLEAVDSIRGDLKGVKSFISLDGKRNNWLEYEVLLEDGARKNYRRVSYHESALLTINYTSGTTSKPKGVMITHRNAAINILGTLAHFHLTASDRYLWTLPMFHCNGWGFVWTIAAVGGTHICLSKVDPTKIFSIIHENGANILCAAPTVLIGLLAAPEEQKNKGRAHKVRLITAGAPPAATTLERVEVDLGWEVTQVYGLTETSPFITVSEQRPEDAHCTSEDRARRKALTGVQMIPNAAVRIVDEGGKDVPKDGRTIGEIIAQGNVVMKGYYQDPEATSKAVHDGWFHTGDAAVMHQDGYIEIKDRFKDVIISGGENISSIEVEGIILRHPAVLEVAVVGVPDSRWGEVPHAYVVLRDGVDVQAEDLRLFAYERMAHFKAPKEVCFIKELPKTATGKVKKFMLRPQGQVISRL